MNNLNEKIEWIKTSDNENIIELKKPLTNDGFILGNLDASGYYRVNYDSKSWENIIKQLKTNKDVIFVE
jgi:hypothetical protein